MIALHAAVSLAEYFGEQNLEALVLTDLEAMHDVWTVLAELAGQERGARSLLMDPKEEQMVQMQGTVGCSEVGGQV